MTSSDDSQDRELLQRYGQASRADPRAPSAEVRTAILDEARRVAAILSAEPVRAEPQRRRISRWKMTAWGTAAAALLAALVIAPRLWDQAPPPTHVAAMSSPAIPFNQAAKTSESAEAIAEPRPVVPVVPVPRPRLESIAPRVLADAPTLRRAVPPPPPVYVPEQSVEVTELARTTGSAAANSARQTQNSSIEQSMAMKPSYATGSDAAGSGAQRRSTESTPSLSGAAAAGARVKTEQQLDQGAAINEYDASGRTPLMVAISQHQIEAVRLLLARGADPNTSDQLGLTPLQLAQQSHFDDVAALLIKAGAR